MMRRLFFICLFTLVTIVSTEVHAEESLSSLPAILDIEVLMGHALEHGLIAGGVVLVGNRHGLLFQRAYGRLSAAPDSPPMGIETIFDLASLTKVVATTSAVMALVEQGKLGLTDPVVKWFPELAGDDKAGLQLFHLLTHTSGFNDLLLPPTDPLACGLAGCAHQPVRERVGRHFRYADINFILLGELVRRVSGETLDRFCAEQFFARLGMTSTAFTPPSSWKSRISATVLPDGSLLTGMPQDGNARLLGGVAGHAGLFSSVADLGRFCRMLLNGGELEGVRVLQEQTVRQMIAPSVRLEGRGIRGLGWDIASPYASPRGHGFSELSFGHTGYSGSSIWIDRERDLFVVLLTARTDYRNVREFNRLRRDLSSIAATLAPSLGQGRAEAGIF